MKESLLKNPVKNCWVIFCILIDINDLADPEDFAMEMERHRLFW